ncbi:MAG TPA: alpha/beta fold hydrolase [Caulobacteraceae bacterium]|jgi:pimeloyl-ACP methyl ester carboxylesterase
MADAPTFHEHLVDGIERIDCTPARRTHATPILFLHGMWHGAWCWRDWQALFAARGWTSRAISLPGHGGSAKRKSIRFSTMQDYLAVVRAEIAAFETPPIVVGHSMGGALTQWYLARVADDLPAAVMLASWTAHSTFADGTALHLKRDPLGFLAMGLTWSAQPLVRNPRRAASMLITEGATLSPQALHARLCEESYLVLSQHNPPLWRPRQGVKTPMLWVAAERDAVITLKGAGASARFYAAEFLTAPGGHNLMMETGNVATAERIQAWLAATGL